MCKKSLAFFAAMRNFCDARLAEGHKVIYLKINDSDNPQSLPQLLQQQLQKTGAKAFEYQLPDEYRLDEQLKSFCQNLNIKTQAVDSEHFYSRRDEFSDFFKRGQKVPMEAFYRRMRTQTQTQILMDNNRPEGGQWNYDKSNRKKWRGKPEVPLDHFPETDLSKLLKEVEAAGVTTMGSIDAEHFNWPVSRAECLQVLDHFCEHLLPFFGDYQDAIHTEQKFLFHSRLSFALNTKMLSPKEVIDKALTQYYAKPSRISLSQIEGFVRQILGWREYMRGLYWCEMPNYRHQNALGNRNPLPAFYWTGNTKMACLQKSIGQSLESAYAHHIQRLMVIGNFALLTLTDPDEVDEWYLGVYIDAIEWVEITNTRGMSQYADGGIVATKPYISSANYINNMSNYCRECCYSPKEKTGESACPFNALYWNFLDEKKEHFSHNPRMGMMLNLLSKMAPEALSALKARAAEIIRHPERY